MRPGRPAGIAVSVRGQPPAIRRRRGEPGAAPAGGGGRRLVAGGGEGGLTRAAGGGGRLLAGPLLVRPGGGVATSGVAALTCHNNLCVYKIVRKKAGNSTVNDRKYRRAWQELEVFNCCESIMYSCRSVTTARKGFTVYFKYSKLLQRIEIYR